MFVVGTESDHIAPWRSVYKIRLFTDGDLTFVLTNGGHNGGILSEPGHKHRHYRLGHRPADALYTSPDEWFESAEEKQGSGGQRWWIGSKTVHRAKLRRRRWAENEGG